ncbi:vacuolar sorting protein 39 domain 1-domain-containing protein [Pisolithus marmoratus]|nr:vacuolar sorting protein 39 domain 1-domain-containing protein [Pisolithus marmoratus]
MAPFNTPGIVISGFKERPESILAQGERLYIGTSTGNLHIYDLTGSANPNEQSKLVETKKGLSRRAIDQLGHVKDINSLVLLSETLVTLYPLPSFSPPTPLTKAKGALSFATYSSVLDTQSSDGGTAAIPTMVTQLIIGCRRKVVIYCWKDGEAQEIKEAVLPHSPRLITFLDYDNVCFAYSPTEYAMFSISRLAAVDVILPIVPATSMGALSGLGSYMMLSRGAKQKPNLVRLSETEVLVVKDNQGFKVGVDGKQAGSDVIDWPGPPDEIGTYVSPYVFSILPPGSVPVPDNEGGSSSALSTTQQTTIPAPVVQVMSSISTLPVQTLPFPFPQPSLNVPVNANCSIRLLTASLVAKSPLFLISTPVDRTVATTEGSSVWKFEMKPWSEQIDELVLKGSYADALALLNTLDTAVLLDKDERRTRIRALNAVAQFRAGKYDDAINTFLELDLNPAKVVALYPERVAGRLSVPQDEWVPLFGGPANSSKPEDLTSTKLSDVSKEGSKEKLIERAPSPTGSVRVRTKTVFGSLLPSTVKDDDVVSLSGRRRAKQPIDDSARAVEVLWRYLTDRRPKVAGALATVNITSAHSHQWPTLSETSTEELFSLPNVPLSSLTPQQLIHFAQIVDTALFKSYLLYRPALLGSLCRVANWCEVSEVEEELRAREKFAELISLYNGKKMHTKALSLLQQLSENEDDVRDKLNPTISYLQKLGPEYLDQIFKSARWVFDQDREIGLQIFMSEDVELPRPQVVDYLEKIDPHISARYIEYLIEEKHEDGGMFHDRLAELYLSITISAKKRGDKQKQNETYAKLLHFIDTTFHYHPPRLYGRLSEDLYEARAILLGRMGRHEHALELYAYKLGNFLKAEEYCKRVYHPDTETSTIFLTLLKLYLRPVTRDLPNLLPPALDLMRRQSHRLDPVETLQLLPPFVSAEEVQRFLRQALRMPLCDSHIIREIHRARSEQVARTLMVLEANRIKVTDSRICPQCHKRLGTSVIAVHAPRGEVTHYQCREAFSKKLNSLR